MTAPRAGAHKDPRFVQIIQANPSKAWHYVFAKTTSRLKQNQWLTPRAPAPTVEDGYHAGIDELQDWIYTGEPLVPLKGFPGIVWQRARRKKRADPSAPF
jgi:hypothetical protein